MPGHLGGVPQLLDASRFNSPSCPTSPEVIDPTIVYVAQAAGVLVAVGVAVGTLSVPLRRNTWSGTPGSMAQPPDRTPQLLQEVAKPPPGLRQAAGLLDAIARSVQAHCPYGLRIMLACTD